MQQKAKCSYFGGPDIWLPGDGLSCPLVSAASHPAASTADAAKVQKEGLIQRRLQGLNMRLSPVRLGLARRSGPGGLRRPY
jgi:hypothetical protein